MVAAAHGSDAGGMTTLLLRSGREAAYLTAGLLTSVLAFTVWVTGVTLSLSLAVFVVGLPVMLASAIVFRWTADFDRRNAAFFLGRPVRGRYGDHRASTFFGRLAATFADPQTWRDFSWLAVHSIVGFAFGVIAVSLIATVAGLAVLPAWCWALPEGVEFGLWSADTLPLAFASALLALPLAVVTAFALRWMALAEAYLAAALLGPR
jgi:hypothetical protein